MAKDSAKNPKTKSSYEESLKAQGTEEPKYTDDERKYRKYLLERLERARDLRESPHDEFDGRTYTDHYIANFKAGNAYIMPRKNAEDTNIVTGTTREKILAVVSAVLNLNFETVMRAFDKNDIEDAQLGEAMSDMIEKSEKVENWDDKKIFAYFELATQGDVFMEENFLTQTKTDKKRVPLAELTNKPLRLQSPDCGEGHLSRLCKKYSSWYSGLLRKHQRAKYQKPTIYLYQRRYHLRGSQEYLRFVAQVQERSQSIS